MGEQGKETEGALQTRQDGSLAKRGGNGEQKRGDPFEIDLGGGTGRTC